MARIKGVQPGKTGLMTRIAYGMARRRVGKIPEPMTITAHHPWLFRGYGMFEFALERARTVDSRLKGLVSLRTAMLIGCPF